jgi:hypothetical protein
MKKSKYFDRVKIPIEIIQSAFNCYFSKNDETSKKQSPAETYVRGSDGTWYFDTFTDFFLAYSPDKGFRFDHIGNKRRFIIESSGSGVRILIESPNKEEIEEVFQIFERDLEKYTLPPEPPKVFIGHGNDPQWKLLKDHLHDQHKIEVLAYEIAPRAGISVKEVLEKLLNSSSIAFLVLTGEDIKNYDELHARENVIHELGLFQGRLGFKRGIILLEEGVAEFSNISGITQIRFSKGNIRETFGDVLAVIKREFDS